VRQVPRVRTERAVRAASEWSADTYRQAPVAPQAPAAPHAPL